MQSKQPTLWLRSGAVLALSATLFAFSGCGKGSGKNIKIDGIDGPNVAFVDDKLTLNIVVKGLAIDYGTRFPIPKLPNSFVEIGPDFQSNGYLIGVGIATDDLQKMIGGGYNSLDPTQLPGGRVLPGVVDGRLPGFAVQVPKLKNITFYFGAAVVGLFVPAKLPWKDYVGTFRFYDGAGGQVGNVSVVGRDQNDANSGVLLLINLKGRVAKVAGLKLN